MPQTKFIAKKHSPEVEQKFEHFYEKVKSMSKINEDLLRVQWSDAVEKWEFETKQSIEEMFQFTEKQKSREIRKIMDTMKKEMKFLIPKWEDYQNTMDALELGLEGLFTSNPSLFT